ncbi:OmpA family protein [Photobacterium sp. CCB-ST2H9]|uniref:OmpA family protein n=1 Tax=Photobacterium sp. CCB-ST2H9 TaxID=2912855 RepID=UPI002004577E|nr:OmpA family protein [Photobacterium sp. CCB-ST2H9]UTM60250.1 OmpA family protein [Photobacterium sp. CCB-ST2H9]
MMKMIKFVPLAIFLSGSVYAATDNPWYFGARVGGTHFDSFDGALDGQKDNFGQDDWGGGVFLGYQFSPVVGFEGGYTYLGEADYDLGSGGFEAYGLDLVAKLSWPVTDVIDIYAKAGGFYFNADNSVNDKDDDGLSATGGLGAEFYINPSMSTRLEYQYYNQVGRNDPGKADIHFYGVSLVYHWGGAAPVQAETMAPAPEPAALPPSMIQPLRVALPFDFDSSKLTQADFDRLKPIADRLVEYPDSKLQVIGHTDASGTPAYNQKLSEERAAAVAGYLAGYFSIGMDRIEIKGFGERDAIAPNNTEEGRAKNRRVEAYMPGMTMENGQ